MLLRFDVISPSDEAKFDEITADAMRKDPEKCAEDLRTIIRQQAARLQERECLLRAVYVGTHNVNEERDRAILAALDKQLKDGDEFLAKTTKYSSESRKGNSARHTSLVAQVRSQDTRVRTPPVHTLSYDAVLMVSHSIGVAASNERAKTSRRRH